MAYSHLPPLPQEPRKKLPLISIPGLVLKSLREGARLVYVDNWDLMHLWVAPIFLTLCAVIAGLSLAGFIEKRLLAELKLSSIRWLPGVILTVGEFLLRLSLWFILRALALLGAILIGQVLAVPWNSRLCEVLDARLNHLEIPNFSIARGLADLIFGAAVTAVLLAVKAFIFVASLLCPPTGFLWMVTGLIVNSMELGWSQLEAPLSHRGLGFGERLRWCLDFWPVVMGLGLVMQLFLWLPVVQLLLMPLGVGASLSLLRHLEAKGHASFPQKRAQLPIGP
ncbi:MAG: hypothetical protein NZM37_04830 [Sandaracinaceae bacterium]|nr:hypothetical protein [Sandaracinaceae bacterium]